MLRNYKKRNECYMQPQETHNMKELMNKMGVGNEEDKLNAKHKPDFFSFKDRHVIPATREAKAGGVQV